MDKIPSQDKIFKSVEGGFHEVMNEECGPELVQGMIGWILARAAGKVTAPT